MSALACSRQLRTPGGLLPASQLQGSCSNLNVSSCRCVGERAGPQRSDGRVGADDDARRNDLRT